MAEPSIALRKLVALAALCACAGPLRAQEDSLVGRILLDEAVVVAQRAGFDVAAFVQRVRGDTTFQHAFLNLRSHPHRTDGELRVHDPSDRTRAGFFRTAHLERTGKRAVQVVDSAWESGRLRRGNGEHRYLTARLFEDLFFPAGPRDVPRGVAGPSADRSGGSRFERYRSDLKRFMFDPGAGIDVPLVGDKLELFAPHMAVHYAMSIWSNVRNGHDCWVFSVDVLPEAPRNAVVVRTLDTWFDKSTGRVIAREYRMAHASLVLSFDISMVVDLAERDGLLVPTHIFYDGDWDLPLQRRERVRFYLRTTDWRAWR